MVRRSVSRGEATGREQPLSVIEIVDADGARRATACSEQLVDGVGVNAKDVNRALAAGKDLALTGRRQTVKDDLQPGSERAATSQPECERLDAAAR
jgi:hypothetical protein